MKLKKITAALLIFAMMFCLMPIGFFATETTELPEDKSGGDAVVACTHANKFKVDFSPSTCTKEGCRLHYECSDCGQLFEEDGVTETTIKNLTMSPLYHLVLESVIENVILPTCTKNGSHDEVKYCSRCSEKLSIETVMDAEAMGHTPGEALIENVILPTCTKNGSHDEVVYCQVCHEELSRIKKIDKAMARKEKVPAIENTVYSVHTDDEKDEENLILPAYNSKFFNVLKTGDESNLELWQFIFAVSGILFVVALGYKIKRLRKSC